jgi:hypothetical protein
VVTISHPKGYRWQKSSLVPSRFRNSSRDAFDRSENAWRILSPEKKSSLNLNHNAFWLLH